MSRYTTVLTLAQRRRALAAQRATEAHVRNCMTCKAEKPCADRKVLELVAEMYESKAIAQ